MNKITPSTLFLLTVFTFLILSTTFGFTEQDKTQTIKGNIVCVELDKERNIKTLEDFNRCSGLLVVIGIDGKSYTISGTRHELQNIAKGSKRKMGVRVTLMLDGIVKGHQRAWRFYSSSLEAEESQKSEERTIVGTIVCLLPDYNMGYVKPVVLIVPCNKKIPHSHIAYTSEGKIYALHGTEEKINKIETDPNRIDVSITGIVQGNDKGRILYIE